MATANFRRLELALLSAGLAGLVLGCANDDRDTGEAHHDMTYRYYGTPSTNLRQPGEKDADNHPAHDNRDQLKAAPNDPSQNNPSSSGRSFGPTDTSGNSGNTGATVSPGTGR